MDKLRLCPFCGEPFTIINTQKGFFTAKHNSDCPMWNDALNCEGYSDREVLIKVLNTRPLEDALIAALKDAVSALDKISDYVPYQYRDVAGVCIAANKGRAVISKAEGAQ